MNAKKFSEAMSELDSKYIEEALNYKKKAQKPVWIKWGAMAACLCLIAAAAITIPFMLSPGESDGGAGGTMAGGSPDILQEAPTLFAGQEVVDAIALDIPDQDIGSWTEVANTALDLGYVIPVYSTANVTKDSHTILETLVFDDQYIIPVMAKDECIGTVTVVQEENKWIICAYEHGFDLKTEVDNHKDTATCFVDVIQLHGRGFLMSADTEEFTAIPGFGISENMSGEELLNQILNHREAIYDGEG